MDDEKVSKEIAIKEIQKFVLEHDGAKKEDWQIENDYPQMLQAVQEGNLVFNDKMIPKLTLKEAIMNTEGEESVSEIDFRTRIKPTQLAEIMKGVDLGKNQMEYSLRVISYLTKQPRAMLDKFGKFDYKVIDQISTVFM